MEFPVFLANHVPMVLVALDRLGASSERMEAWYETYRAKSGLPPIPAAVAPIDSRDWRAALGDRAREADFRSFFAKEVERLGIAGAVQTYLPSLIQGVAGSATHPLMRLAYGILEQDRERLASPSPIGPPVICPFPRPASRRRPTIQRRCSPASPQ